MESGKTAECVKMWEFTWVFWSHWLESPLRGIWIFWWTVAHQNSLSITISWGLLKLKSIESMMPSNHSTLCLSPFSSCPQPFPASWSFPMSQFFALNGQSIGASASVLPMNIQVLFPLELTGLISLLFQGILKNLLQHHISKVLILWYSAFFMVQLSHPYMTTRKTITLTMWTFIDKVMSLLFNIYFRFVISFLPRSKCLFRDYSHYLQWFLSPRK